MLRSQRRKQGILFIAAAGNQPVTTPFYPAASPDVLAVTAVDNGQLAPYASRGSFVTLGAPGTSTVYYQGQPWIVQGTSASTAFVTGTAAGNMDSTHNSASQTQAYLNRLFGVKIVPAN